MDAQTATNLINLDKHVIEKGKIIDTKIIKLESPIRLRLDLVSSDDSEQVFIVDIKESEKKALKISLHHLDDITKHGLLRIDYHQRHKNPEVVLESVPEKFKPYAGIYLDKKPGHIHYVVDGYKQLVWAIPLDKDNFRIKDISRQHGIIPVLKSFFDIINVRTNIDLHLQMRLQ
ncbi:MAG: DUF6978 family protein [Sedimentisphaeraceae bacterium JB056]